MKLIQAISLLVIVRRAPHGARGLKLLSFHCLVVSVCRAPHGARGLKYHRTPSSDPTQGSRPARGAWIEISNGLELRKSLLVAPRTGRVD